MSFSYNILVLDDDTLVTSSLKSLLTIEGFSNAVFFNSPAEAVSYLQNNKMDVIISDFIMPEMNGLEFLSKAKELCPNSSRILLTGYADKENAIRAINEVGLYKYIEKPWDNDEFVLNIKNAYERAHLVDALEEKNRELENYSKHLEDMVKQKTAGIIEINEKLSAVINNCADGIVIFSYDKKIIDINPAAETMFGMTKDIIETKSIEELFAAKDISWEEVFFNQNQQFLREISVKNAVNGNIIPVEISCAFIPPKESGEKGTFVFVIRDVNLQKDMERLREDFIATLTHDLRTPSLASIQTLEYFLNGALGKLNDKQNMLLATMKKSQEDMLGLINTLLEVYKYESGRLQLVKTSFDFQNLIEECIAQVKPILENKKQTIEKIYLNFNHNNVYADRNEIRRVIINLIGNAIKYTQNEGLITVKAEIEGNDLHFSVKDNGEGIYKQDIPKLFKRFSQGTHEKRSISTGLGLYLSKQIIDAHGGKIWLESDKGKGSEFFFLLLDAVKSDEKDKLWTA